MFVALICGGAIGGSPRGEEEMGEEEASDIIACRRFEPIVGVRGRTSASAGETGYDEVRSNGETKVKDSGAGSLAVRCLLRGKARGTGGGEGVG